MKAMKERGVSAEQVRDLSLDQIADKIVELKKEQFNLRFQKATGQLENTTRSREIKRDIARLKTIQTQKQAAAQAS